MSTHLKSLSVSRTVSTLKLEHDNIDSNDEQEKEILAIAILLGGYNQYGRKISLEDYQKIKDRFKDCIQEVKELL